MVTASCRIGYDFSTPDGPLTMKLAETPSRSAGLIISVFGVASSPMASLLARKNRRLEGAPSVRGRAGSVKERPREGSLAELLLRRLLLHRRLRAWIALRAGLGIGLPLRRRSGVLGRRQLRQRSLDERLAVHLRVLVVVRDQRHLPLIHARQVLALGVGVALGVRLDLSDQDGIAGGRDEPGLVDLARRRGSEAVRVEAHPGLSVRLLAPGRGAPGGAGRLAALPGPRGLQDRRGPARVAQPVELDLELADPLLHLGDLLLLLLEGLLRLGQLLARLRGLGREVGQERHGD